MHSTEREALLRYKIIATRYLNAYANVKEVNSSHQRTGITEKSLDHTIVPTSNTSDIYISHSYYENCRNW